MSRGGWRRSGGCESLTVPDLDLIVGGERHGGLAVLGLAAASEQMLEEGEGTPSRRGDYFPAVGIDDCDWLPLGLFASAVAETAMATRSLLPFSACGAAAKGANSAFAATSLPRAVCARSVPLTPHTHVDPEPFPGARRPPPSSPLPPCPASRTTSPSWSWLPPAAGSNPANLPGSSSLRFIGAADLQVFLPKAPGPFISKTISLFLETESVIVRIAVSEKNGVGV